ncbi:OLC1v1039001C1 [Oldenlandia corymbosa var. corymbosa]|uniref:OLC1v1039001C1 n=1 Tax=Oldenlandia corymbosa var. corymbosa TaxID=529605 RepID=A0AAV1D226_OLDCO|nr:OLC1v1039001C1 [Oldenlandia corymbosa var. corymbosa]
METPTLFLSIVLVILFCICVLKINSSSRKASKLPPGPYPLPVIGNIFQLGGVFHVSLAELSKTYGSLMTIHLGSRTTFVVSSSDIAKQILSKHEHLFIRRPVTDASRALDHDKFSAIWLPATSGQWRNLRKLCKEQIFSSERLNSSQGLRQEKMQQLRNYLQECCNTGKVVNICEAAFTTSLNLTSNTIFSVDFADYGSSSSQELKEIVTGVMKSLGAPNVSDFLPFLKYIDPLGIRRQAKYYLGKLFQSFDDLITQRLQERRTSLDYSRKDDFLETLLDLTEQEGAEWRYQDIKHLILDLIYAGTETTSLTVEWAMTELLRNPGKLRKARDEIKEVIGHNNIVQESDISRLPYLQALVKETFRLHPVVSVLVKLPEEDVKVEQSVVPKGGQIFVNIWAIGRDPSQWPNPDAFVPERFLSKEIDVKGQHFELLPFGTGRRICLGMPLAHRMLHLMLATLLHKFDWKLEDGIRPEDIDMAERFCGTVQKAVPLKAIPILDYST